MTDLKVRRFVTGHNAEGKSIFLSDDFTPHTRSRGIGSTIVAELWETTQTPASNEGDADAAARPFRLPPPANGSIFRVISYPPDSERMAALKAEHATTHDDGTGRAQAIDRNNPRHLGFHKTDSIDYAIVLKGEIYAMMDEGERLMKAGDVLVQRGTNHAWSNRTNEHTLVAFVLIGAEPV